MPTVGGMNESWVVSVCPTGAYICQNISLCWIYAANNFGSICKLDIYVGVGYSLLGIIVGAFGGTFSKIWIYAANNLGGKCCYKIYHANSWGMNVSWV